MAKPPLVDEKHTLRQRRLRDLYHKQYEILITLTNIRRYLDDCIAMQEQKVAVLNYRYTKAMGWEPLKSNFDHKNSLQKLMEQIKN